MPLQFIQIIVRLDRSKLDYLIKGSINDGRLSIVEYKCHAGAMLSNMRNLKFKIANGLLILEHLSADIRRFNKLFGRMRCNSNRVRFSYFNKTLTAPPNVYIFDTEIHGSN